MNIDFNSLYMLLKTIFLSKKEDKNYHLKIEISKGILDKSFEDLIKSINDLCDNYNNSNNEIDEYLEITYLYYNDVPHDLKKPSEILKLIKGNQINDESDNIISIQFSCSDINKILSLLSTKKYNIDKLKTNNFHFDECLDNLKTKIKLSLRLIKNCSDVLLFQDDIFKY